MFGCLGRLRWGRLKQAFTAVPPTAADFADGERIVWFGMMGERCRAIYGGTVLWHGPGEDLTVRFDGAPTDAQVRPWRVIREAEYLDYVATRGAPRPTRWGG